MSIFARIFTFILGIAVTLSSFSFRTISDRAEDFRVTAYVVGNNFVNEKNIDASHFSDITDVILFGVSSFNTAGEVVLSENFDKVLTNVRNAIGDSPARLHLNLLGPGAVGSFDTWEEQMDSQGKQHDIAFRSGKLQKNIKDVLDKYSFDGVFFDYEYPEKEEHWKVFDEFLVSFDSYLGDDYILGCAFSPWHDGQSKEAMKVLDMVEVMAYDLWEEDGTHSSFKDAKYIIKLMLEMGYEKSQLDLGIPFYARPTTQEAYWYGYNGNYDKLDKNGFCFDEETGLTFSFNTYDVVYEKTQWAIMKGLGGAMVWHYSCDVPKENSLSLFNAMHNAIEDTAHGRIFRSTGTVKHRYCACTAAVI